MLQKLLDIGMTFDWITPVIAQIQDIANGPHRTFLISEGSGWSGHQVGRMLRDHGVKYWGMMIVEGKLMLTVRQQQAGWTQYLLQREGIPLLNPLPSGRPTATSGTPAAPPAAHSKAARRHSFLDDLNGLVDSMADRLGL